LQLLVDYLVSELKSPPWHRELAKATAIEEVKGRGKSASVPRTNVDVEDRGHRRAVSR
jgi:hypothetical protein